MASVLVSRKTNSSSHYNVRILWRADSTPPMKAAHSVRTTHHFGESRWSRNVRTTRSAFLNDLGILKLAVCKSVHCALQSTISQKLLHTREVSTTRHHPNTASHHDFLCQEDIYTSSRACWSLGIGRSSQLGYSIVSATTGLGRAHTASRQAARYDIARHCIRTEEAPRTDKSTAMRSHACTTLAGSIAHVGALAAWKSRALWDDSTSLRVDSARGS
jgi:hypothetical protein